ncbi:germination protein YpeB [Halobacillus shinanisalinarum]|uniref:Germination protein YpeB n=1 Tax=Halobacillus shinanisalinarum TaxID=2932258 RepID=A0ABY4H0B6_9BACI|nr:germination protein YpeB [Halobacillus shinanisalinarum]UOQ93599.1 germination protein YpeB [Halobacillus shinanisalinarum]
MFRWITITVLALAIIGLGVFGYKENQEKNAILLQAENNYQRAFHELTYDMDLLHDKIGATLAMNTRQQISPQLAEIWRLTSEAKSNVGQLPLTLLPFNKTEEFLYNIGDFSYNTAVRDLENKPLTDQEIKGLESLYKQSGKIKDELRQVQSMVLSENLRWMDVQLALATNEENGDNTIINGFKTVEKSMEDYKETNMETGIATSGSEEELSKIKGEEINKAQAKEIAAKWLKGANKSNLTITTSGEGANIETITASYQEGDTNGYIDMSKKGGHPLTVMVSRAVKEPKISLYEGSNKAKSYLEGIDLADVELVESSQYEHVGVYRFVYKKDGIRYYPDSVQMKIALDNGDLLGMTAIDYFSHHDGEAIKEASISEEEAREKVNPNLEIQEQHLSVIENESEEQVLCYEFLTTMDDETYRIFINAWDGTEEKVEILHSVETKYEPTL